MSYSQEQTEELLQEIVKAFKQLLGENLIGVYLHGSLAMGGFHPLQSDVDFLVVVKDKLNRETKQEAANLLLKFSDKAPPKGLEMSIVLAEFLNDFVYPTPFEFHFGPEHISDYQAGKVVFENQQKADHDLAAHFTITKKHGKCLYGESIDEVFGEVPKKYYLDSIARDSDWSFKNIQEKTGAKMATVPQYAVLNFCRVLAFIDQGMIVSKEGGGQWALKNLPEKFRPIISAALQERTEAGTSNKVDPDLLKDFANYAHDKISEQN